MADQTLETLNIFEGDEVKPQVNLNYIRLYGHMLCPFVEKARIALAARAIPFQQVNIDLTKKAAWHVALGGLVPILELQDGTLINESKVIMEYAEDAYPKTGYSLLPANVVERALLRVDFKYTDALMSVYWTPLFKKAVVEEDFLKIREKLQALEDYATAHAKETSPFLGGTENPSQLDVHVYVLISRIPMMKSSATLTAFQEAYKFDSFPRLAKMVTAIKDRPEFRGVLAYTSAFLPHVEKNMAAPLGIKVQLYLPIPAEE
jgi:glutathione S-transferase